MFFFFNDTLQFSKKFSTLDNYWKFVVNVEINVSAWRPCKNHIEL